MEDTGGTEAGALGAGVPAGDSAPADGAAGTAEVSGANKENDVESRLRRRLPRSRGGWKGTRRRVLRVREVLRQPGIEGEARGEVWGLLSR